MSFRNILKYAGIIIGIGLIGFIAIQFIPIDTTNPPVVREPNWDSPQTRDLAKRACFDCHSNETVWPPYSKIAPISWIVTNHVVEGRRELNFSNWHPREQNEAIETIIEGSMPPLYYTATHPAARLSAAEKQALIDGLQKTIRNSQNLSPAGVEAISRVQ